MPKAWTNRLELVRKRKISKKLFSLWRTRDFRNRNVRALHRHIQKFGLSSAMTMSQHERKKKFRKRICRICKNEFRPNSGRSLTCTKCLKARPFCACGCGNRVSAIAPGALKLNKFLRGHCFSGVAKSLEHREKLSKSIRSYVRENKKDVLARARDPKRVRKICLSLAKRFSTGIPTKPEEAMSFILTDLKLKYRFQVSIDKYVVDFLVGKKLVVECDGDYWHSLPASKKNDKKKDCILKKLGYIVLRFSESQLKKNREFVVKVLCKSLDRLY